MVIFLDISRLNLLFHSFLLPLLFSINFLNIYITSQNQLIHLNILSGMISLLVGLGTYQKQWTFFETIDRVDKMLNKEFLVITPKKVIRSILWSIVIATNVLMIIFFFFNYFIYESLGIPALMLSVSYYWEVK